MTNLLKETFEEVVVANESLDYLRKSKLLNRIADEVTELRKKSKIFRNNGDMEAIEKVIFEETGIKAHIVPSIFAMAHVFPPAIDKNHSLNGNMSLFVRYLNAGKTDRNLKKSGAIIDGGCDDSTGRVYGDFSDIQCKIGVSSLFFHVAAVFTAKEVAAIIIHELGHIYYMFKLLGENYSTSTMMAQLVDDLKEVNDPKERKLIASEYRKNRLKTLSVDDVAEAKDEETISMIVIRDKYEAVRSENKGFNLFDLRDFERLADNYAVQHRGGKHLNSALNKLYADGIDSPFIGNNMKMFLYGMQLLESMYYNVGLALVSPFLLKIKLSMTAASIVTGDVYNDLYGDAKERAEAIRQMQSAALKNDELTSSEKKTILASIAEIEAVWNETETFRPLSRVVAELLPAGKRKVSVIEMNKKIEALGFNRLAEAAAIIETA